MLKLDDLEFYCYIKNCFLVLMNYVKVWLYLIVIFEDVYYIKIYCVFLVFIGLVKGESCMYKILF